MWSNLLSLFVNATTESLQSYSSSRCLWLAQSRDRLKRLRMQTQLSACKSDESRTLLIRHETWNKTIPFVRILRSFHINHKQISMWVCWLDTFFLYRDRVSAWYYETNLCSNIKQAIFIPQKTTNIDTKSSSLQTKTNARPYR